MFLKLATTNASQKKQNDTLSAVTIATLSAHFSFSSFLCQKAKYPNLQPLKWHKGFYLEQTYCSHIVFAPIIRLVGVDSSCFKTKLGISVFINTARAAKLLPWQQFCFFWDVRFKLAVIFWEISFIQYFATS